MTWGSAVIYNHPVRMTLFVRMWCNLWYWHQHPLWEYSQRSAWTPILDNIDSHGRNDFSCCCWIKKKNQTYNKWILLSSKWWPWDWCNSLMLLLMLLLLQMFSEFFFSCPQSVRRILVNVLQADKGWFLVAGFSFWKAWRVSGISSATEMGDRGREHWFGPTQYPKIF